MDKIREEITQEKLDNMSLEQVEALNKQMESELKEMYDVAQRNLVLKSLEGKERLHELIGKLKVDNFLMLDVCGVPIKIQRTLREDQRTNLFGLEDKKDKISAVDFGEELRNFMADICLEEPFNSVEAWELLDKETGEIMSIFLHATTTLVEEIKDTHRFRRERRPNRGRDVQVGGRAQKPQGA